MRWVLIWCAVVLAVPAWAGPAEKGAPAAKEDTRPLVVVDYFDVTPETDPDIVMFRKGLAQILIADLVATDRFRVVDRDRLEEAQKELDFQYSGRVDPTTRVKLGKLLGAQWYVYGQILKGKKAIVITAKVNSHERWQTVASARVTVTDDDVMSGEEELASKLAAGILEAAKKAPVEGAGQTAGRKPRGKLPYKTAVAYAKALDAKDQKNPELAKAELQKVVEAQPDFTLAKVDLLALMK